MGAQGAGRFHGDLGNAVAQKGQERKYFLGIAFSQSADGVHPQSGGLGGIEGDFLQRSGHGFYTDETPVSLMPDGLELGMTVQDFRDLLAYLETLQ